MASHRKPWSSVLAIMLVSCSASGLSDNGGTGGTGGTGGAGGTGGTGSAGGTGGTGTGGTGGTTTGRQCQSYSECIPEGCGLGNYDKPKCAFGDPRSYDLGSPAPCEEVCWSPCCSGTGCRIRQYDCPTGTVCVYPTSGIGAECVDESKACGGFLGDTCGPGEYCEMGNSASCYYVNGGATGVCYPLPDDTACANTSTPVCGCDGVMYANDCARKAANVTADRWGDSCSKGTGGTPGRGGAGGVRSTGGVPGGGGSVGTGGTG